MFALFNTFFHRDTKGDVKKKCLADNFQRCILLGYIILNYIIGFTLVVLYNFLQICNIGNILKRNCVF